MKFFCFWGSMPKAWPYDGGGDVIYVIYVFTATGAVAVKTGLTMPDRSPAGLPNRKMGYI